jgi:hypothetical protein
MTERHNSLIAAIGIDIHWNIRIGSTSEMVGPTNRVRSHPNRGPKLAEPVRLVSARSGHGSASALLRFSAR